MKLYCTTKNTGPMSVGPDPLTMLYLGSSEEEAIAAVGDFTKYEQTCPVAAPKYLCALPSSVDVTLLHYYMADGWWRTVFSFEIEDPEAENTLIDPDQADKEVQKVWESYLRTQRLKKTREAYLNAKTAADEAYQLARRAWANYEDHHLDEEKAREAYKDAGGD